MRKLTLILSGIILLFSACGNKKNTSKTQVLKLSHNHPTGYPVDMAYKKFAEIVNKKSNGRYKIEIYPDGQLGNSVAALELVQSGVLQFAHINTAALEGFDEIYSVLNLPYIFKDYKHYRAVMDSKKVRDIFESTVDKGFLPIIYLEGGARSFYTKNKPILKPSDLKGLKIRVQESPTSIEMVKRLGGTPVVINYGEVYTSLQQGIIDGAENNAPSLVTSGHAEVAKQFSLNKHTRFSDILAMSASLWNSLSEEDKQLFRDSANETIDYFADVWKSAENNAFEQAKTKYHVTINEVDIKPFRELVIPMHDEFAQKDPRFNDLITYIRSLEKQ